MHFKIAEIHKQRVNSVCLHKSQLQTAASLVSSKLCLFLSLSEWLLKSPEPICYSNFTMFK